MSTIFHSGHQHSRRILKALAGLRGHLAEKAASRIKNKIIIGLMALASLLVLAAPAAAQASVHHRLLPNPAASAHPGIRLAGHGFTLQGGQNIPGTVYPNNDRRFYYPYNCEVVVGDHRRSDSYAAGEGDLVCPYADYFYMKVYLDYRLQPGGALYTATEASASTYHDANAWWDVATPGACATSGNATTFYWTTYVEISWDGGPWHGWYTSAADVPYKVPGC
jgi:hypothetical protein